MSKRKAPINPWYKRKLEEQELWPPESQTAQYLRTIVECEPDYREQVKSALLELPNVTVIDQADVYIRVYAPVEAIPKIQEILHVVEVPYDVPVRIYTYNPLWDPLVGSIKPSEVEFELPGPDLLFPLPFLPLPRIMLGVPFRYKFIPTSESKKIILDQPTKLTGKGVKVAVLDTGIELLHPQIKGKAKAYSECFIEPWPLDGCGHGQWCCTCVGGDEFRAIHGVCEGVAPECDLISVKVLSTFGSGTMFDVIKGMTRAAVEGAKVISMSLGSDECQGGCDHCPECKTVKRLTKLGHILVIAAGNAGPDQWTIGCPGCSPDAVTVGSYSITDDDVAWFSSRGPSNKENRGREITAEWLKPDCIAPGGGRKEKKARPDEMIYSGIFGWIDGMYSSVKHGFEGCHGTSMATPHVSPLIALLVQDGKVNTAEDFKRVLREKGLPKNEDRGYGLVKLSWWY